MYDHETKAALFWNAFKNRLGRAEGHQTAFDLQAVLNNQVDLSSLEDPFTHEEIDEVVKNLPSNKSPGPDGFNTDFIKKCWQTIKFDFYELCNQFHSGNISLAGINICYITLIPKSEAADGVNDFKPISLLNCTLKLITKLLANRLQTIIMKIIHQNQYGFIKGRTIQDCLAWAFEYLHACHKSKKEVVLLKLDFEKAFDKVEFFAIIQIMQSMGFGDRWCNCIRSILGSATSQILLNGVPGKLIHCKRGVRQGGPLSPLPFVIVADLLQSVINDAMRQGSLSKPIQIDACPDFPIIQFVDDTLIIMQAHEAQLQVLQNILTRFHASTGLKIIFHKSSTIPINMAPNRTHALAEILGCKIGTIPFTYLGLSLGTTKPKLEEFLPLIQRVEKRLTCFSSMLSYGGRLQLVNWFSRHYPLST